MYYFMEEKIFPRILDLLIQHFDTLPLQPEEITLDTQLHEDLDLDSLDIVDFILLVETNFNVKLDMNDAKNTHTLRDLANAVLTQNPSLCAG